MLRGLALAMLFLVLPSGVIVQESGALKIRIALRASDQTLTPIRRHVLLISDNPATAPPRRLLTTADGTAEVRLPPGNYTVESDRPIAFDGKAYQWTQIVDIAAGRDTTLDLTADNAEVEVVTATSTATSAPDDFLSLSSRWQDSVIAVWTPTAHASGFVIDRSGLIVTNQRAVDAATSVEVQISPNLKVPASVIAADEANDLAVIRIAPGRAAALRPVPLGCGTSLPAPAKGDEIFTIEAPLGREKGPTTGVVRSVGEQVLESDLAPNPGGSGGPVFSARGAVIGITSVREERPSRRRGDASVIRIAELCAVLGLANAKIGASALPSDTALPLEPGAGVATKALEDIVAKRAGSLNPYRIAAADFDISFLTPIHVYAGQKRAMSSGVPVLGRGAPDAAWLQARLVTDFGNWSDYVEDMPAVLMIRVTPKLVEGFWTKVARGAASTQGMSLPPIKRIKSGFAGLRAYCGDTEITPIHPFVIEQEVPGGNTVNEGLYVFDPARFATSCGTIKLTVFSQQEPKKADTRVIDAKLIEQISTDFASLRGPG